MPGKSRGWMFVVALLLGSALHAQNSTGSVSGEVTDISGALITGADVTLTDLNTHLAQTTKTNEQGVYEFSQVMPGSYELQISHKGFHISETQFTVDVEQAQRFDARLIVGAQNMVIDVHADAVTLDLGTSSLGTVISDKEVQDLPLDGRNVFALAGLAPGVLPGESFGVGLSTMREAAIAAGANNFRVSGGITGSNEILLDGIPITVCCQGQPALIPNPDLVQQFRVQTSVPPANFGRSSGGTLNFVTKSGASRVSGDIYEYMRNTIFDANNWFAKQAGYPRPPLVYNQFGGVIGGPLLIPHVLDGKKTFFFFGFEGVQSARKTFSITTVPTQLQREGELTEEPGITYDPTTEQAVYIAGILTIQRKPLLDDNGVCCGVPKRLQDPIAMKLMNLFPLPNRANAPVYTNNYQFYVPQFDDDFQYNGRIDRTINSRYSFFLRGTYNTDIDLIGSMFGNFHEPNATQQNLQASVFEWGNTVLLTPNTVLNAHYGFAWQQNVTHSAGLNQSAAVYGFPASFTSLQPTPGIPTQNISGYNGLSTTTATELRHYTHSFSAAVTMQRGRQTLLAGWDGRIFDNNVYPMTNGAGGFDYTDAFTTGPTSGVAPTPVGQAQFDSFAEFLMGSPDLGGIQNTSRFSYQQPYNALYFQDDWRILPKLTLNLGVRYELEEGAYEKNGKQTVFDPNAVNPIISTYLGLSYKGALEFTGTNGYSKRMWKMPLSQVGPRIGAAYTLTNNIVARGAYGIIYLPTTQRLSNAGNSTYNVSTQFAASINNGGTATGADLDNPYPNGIESPWGPSNNLSDGIGSGVYSVLYNSLPGYVQQYNFGLMTQMSPSVILNMAYSGSNGVHLPQTLSANDLNPKYFGAPGDMATVNKIYYTTTTNPFYPLFTMKPQRMLPGYLTGSGISGTQGLAAFPQYVGVTEQFVSNGQSTYNSLQAGLQVKSKLVTSTIAYTWSKSLGNINNNIANDTGAPAYQNSYDLKIERSVDPADVTHRFSGSAIVSLPFGHGQQFLSKLPRWADNVVGGWQVTIIQTFQTGLPLNLNNSGQPEGAGSRPSYVPGVAPLTHGPAKFRLGNGMPTYLNPAAFTFPLAFQFGDVRRTADGLRGPGVDNTNMSALKTFNIYGTWRLQLRGEAFNLFNRVQFGQPGQTYGLSSFGTITSTQNLPRQIQVAMKLFW